MHRGGYRKLRRRLNAARNSSDDCARHAWHCSSKKTTGLLGKRISPDLRTEFLPIDAENPKSVFFRPARMNLAELEGGKAVKARGFLFCSNAGPQKASVDPSATSTTPAAQYNHLKALTGLIKLSRHTEESVLVFLRKTHRCVESSASLAEVAGQQPQAIIWAHDNWRSVDQELARTDKERTL